MSASLELICAGMKHLGRPCSVHRGRPRVRRDGRPPGNGGTCRLPGSNRQGSHQPRERSTRQLRGKKNSRSSRGCTKGQHWDGHRDGCRPHGTAACAWTQRPRHILYSRSFCSYDLSRWHSIARTGHEASCNAGTACHARHVSSGR